MPSTAHDPDAEQHHGTRRSVGVVGAAGPLGRRVVARLAADPEVARVVAIDRHRWSGLGSPTSAEVERVVGAATLDDGGSRLEGVDALVYLAPTTRDGPGPDGTGTSSGSAQDLAAALEAAGTDALVHVVLLSSATVYGAAADNPVPLTEAAPVCPAPAVPLAQRSAAREARLASWRRGAAGRTATVLRSTIAVGPETRRWFARSPWAAIAVRSEEGPPLQLVHLDDLADAIALACSRRIDGPRNVAPAGWLSAEEVAALAGPAGRFRGLARVLDRVRPGRRGGPEDLGGTPYEQHAWVVASDELRADGWDPRSSSAEAFVEVDDPGPLGQVSAKRRQQLSLGVVAAAVGVVALAVVLLVRRRRPVPR